MSSGDVVRDQAGHSVACDKCGAHLSAGGEDWRDHALVERTNAAERLNSGDFGPAFHLSGHEDLELVETFCPRCKALLAIDLYLRGEPTQWTFRSLAVAGSQGYDPLAEREVDPERWISFGAASVG